MNKLIVVFDCDSTLTYIEGIDELARLKGVEGEVSAITAISMNGDLDFGEALQKRLSLVKPNKSDLEWLGKKYIEAVLPDAKEVIKSLAEASVDVYMVSGGYKKACDIFADYLGIRCEKVFAVDLFFDDLGRYIGLDLENPLTKDNGKKLVLEEIAQLGNTVFVGDSVKDMMAKSIVNLFIGFGGVVYREVVKNGSEVYLKDKSLDAVLDIVLNKNFDAADILKNLPSKGDPLEE